MNDIYRLLEQSHPCPAVSPYIFYSIVHALPPTQKMFVYIDKDATVCGIISIVIEQKLSHGCQCVAHITDLEIDSENENRAIAYDLIDHAVEVARRKNCVRIVAIPKENFIPDFINNYFDQIDGFYVRRINDKIVSR